MLGLHDYGLPAVTRDSIQCLPEYNNTNKVGASFETPCGHLLIKPVEYMELISSMRPNIWVTLADEVPTWVSDKRNRTSVDRTVRWLDDCIALSPMLLNWVSFGSSFCWNSHGLKFEEVGAVNLLPKELSLKIVSKIEAGERFTVYVVIPLWPEGIPESASVQAILNWENRTMEMMYKDIVQALQTKGKEANPKDYLTFFCLGNREMRKSGEYEPSEKPE